MLQFVEEVLMDKKRLPCSNQNFLNVMALLLELFDHLQIMTLDLPDGHFENLAEKSATS